MGMQVVWEQDYDIKVKGHHVFHITAHKLGGNSTSRWAPQRVEKNGPSGSLIPYLSMNGGTSPRLSQRKSLQRQRRPREYTLVDVSTQAFCPRFCLAASQKLCDKNLGWRLTISLTGQATHLLNRASACEG